MDAASPEKRRKQIEKCRETTSLSLGMRCCGMRVYLTPTSRYRVWDKHYGRKIKRHNFKVLIDTSCVAKFVEGGGYNNCNIKELFIFLVLLAIKELPHEHRTHQGLGRYC